MGRRSGFAVALQSLEAIAPQKAMVMVSDSRPSALAGTWYPAQPAALRAALDTLLKTVEPVPLSGRLLGLLVPHAGYRYSGAIAANAFGLLRGLFFDTVVVIGPMHHPILGTVLTSGHTSYVTPLGEMQVDQDVLHELSAYGIPLTPIRDDPEHSIEIELPFLQHTLHKPEQTALVPLMLNDQSVGTAARLAAALSATLKGRRVLLVASSDLSHFYTESAAHLLDAEVLARFSAYDPDGIIEADQARVGFSCGRGAIAAVLRAARDLGADTAAIVGYGTSADTSGDRARVVGYGAGAITATL